MTKAAAPGVRERPPGSQCGNAQARLLALTAAAALVFALALAVALLALLAALLLTLTLAAATALLALVVLLLVGHGNILSLFSAPRRGTRS
jgi:hypothetical protein